MPSQCQATPCSFSKLPAWVQRSFQWSGAHRNETWRGRRRRARRSGVAHRADAPGAVLGAEHVGRIDLDPAARGTDLALPAAELVEAGRLHVAAGAGGMARRALVALGEARGPRDPEQVGREPGLVVGQADPQALHRLEDLDREGADLDLAPFRGRAAGAVEGVLLAVVHDREAAVDDAEVRVDRGADPEVHRSVVAVAVPPVAVVRVAVRRRDDRQWLARLMDRVVVQSGQHLAPPRSEAYRVAPARRAGTG